MLDDSDFYTVLGISPQADAATIRQAYRQLARRYHPDVAGPASMERMSALNRAYAVLSDPERRRDYHLRHGLPLPGERVAPAASQAPAQAARRGSLSVSDGPLRHVATLEETTMPIVSVALTPDGRLAALGLLDGQVALWDAPAGRRIARLAMGAHPEVGVLQEVRLSPTGAFAVAWGFSLGLRVWRVGDGQLVWSASMSAPHGLLDAVPLDDLPALRLALPASPFAVALNDPFRWAENGNGGSDVLTHSLAVPDSRAEAIPLRCDERGRHGLLGGGQQPPWRVLARRLSTDGRRLLTVTTLRPRGPDPRQALTRWRLPPGEARRHERPSREERAIARSAALHLPLAVAPDLGVVAVCDGVAQVRLCARGVWRPTLAVGTLGDDPELALSPEGRFLAVARGASLALYRASDGQEVQRWRFADDVAAIAFVPDGARLTLLVGLSNGMAELWSAPQAG